MKNNTIFTQKIVYAILTLGCLGSNAFGMRNFDIKDANASKTMQAALRGYVTRKNMALTSVVPKDKLIACSDYFKHMFSFTDSLHNSQKQKDLSFSFESDTPQEIIDALITYFKTFQTDQHAQAVENIKKLITSDKALYLYDLACRICIQPIIDLCGQNILNNKHFCVLLHNKNISKQLKELCPTAKQEKIELIESNFKEKLDYFTGNRSDIITEQCKKNPAYFDWQNPRIIERDDWVNHIAFNPYDNYLTATSDDRISQLIQNNITITTILMTKDSTHCAFSPCGNYFANASSDKTCQLFDINNDTIITTINHSGEVYHVAFSPCGNYLATASRDNTCKLYDIKKNSIITTINHTESAYRVAFSPCGNYLATTSGSIFDDYSICQFYDIQNKRTIATSNHTGWVNHIAFSPCGKYLATASRDNTCKVFSVGSEKRILKLIEQKTLDRSQEK
jgi:WD40 repeat protein